MRYTKKLNRVEAWLLKKLLTKKYGSGYVREDCNIYDHHRHQALKNLGFEQPLTQDQGILLKKEYVRMGLKPNNGILIYHCMLEQPPS